MTTDPFDKNAILSDCGTYRYRLERPTYIGSGWSIGVIMVNPSTADATTDDHTIRKCVGLAKRQNAGKVIVGNKFAYRATDVTELRTATDPIGSENPKHIEQIMRDADLVVVAWGPLAKLPKHLRNHWTEVVLIAQRLGVKLHCWGTAKDGQPRHPLMLAYSTPLVEWIVP